MNGSAFRGAQSADEAMVAKPSFCSQQRRPTPMTCIASGESFRFEKTWLHDLGSRECHSVLPADEL